MAKNYYQAGGNNGEILGAKPTSASVSPDGMFAMITSVRNQQAVFACLHPLGDPGDPTQQPNFASFSYTQTTAAKCMQVGMNNLKQDITTTFGPDNQPYFGGQRVVNAFNGNPGGSFPTAWPDEVRALRVSAGCRSRTPRTSSRWSPISSRRSPTTARTTAAPPSRCSRLAPVHR